MAFDPTTYTGGHHLVPFLERHNPWWGFDDEFDPAGGVDARRPAYREAVARLVDGEDRLAVGGLPAAETAGLLEQLVATVLRPEFQEQYVQDAALRAAAGELVVPAGNVLRLPLGASPLFEVQPAAGIGAAVDHFRTHVATPDRRQYLFLDGLGAIRRPNRRGSDAGSAWLDALADVVGIDGLTVVVSVPSAPFLAARLRSTPPGGTDAAEWGVQSLTHPGFDAYLRLRHRRLAVAPTEQRFDPAAARRAFRTAVRTGAPASFVEHVRRGGDRLLEPATLRRELTMFTVGGGRLGTRLARAGVDLDGPEFETLLRDRGDESLGAHQSALVDDLRTSVTDAADRLYGLADSPGPMRLAAVVAAERPTEPVAFDDVCTVLDVDRRTLRSNYLRTLEDVALLGGAPAYANERPRSIGLQHRDPSVLAALAGFDLRDGLRREPGLAPELWHAAAYDHTVRLSEAVNDPRDPKRGVVKHWTAEGGVVDFVPKIDGRPVPVVVSPDRTLAALSRSDAADYAALCAFLRRTGELADADALTPQGDVTVPASVVDRRASVVTDESYFGRRRDDAVVDGTAPFGVVVTNARAAMTEGVTVDDDGPKPILQLPLWTYLRLASPAAGVPDGSPEPDAF